MADVLPALRTNADGLKKVLDDLMKQYKSKQDEMDNWKVRPISLSLDGEEHARVKKSRPKLTGSSPDRKRTISRSFSSDRLLAVLAKKERLRWHDERPAGR